MRRVPSPQRVRLRAVTLAESALAISIFAFVVAAAVVIGRPLLEASHNRAVITDLRVLLSSVASLSRTSPGYGFLGHPAAAAAHNSAVGKGADLLVSSGVLPERFGTPDGSSTTASEIWIGSGRLPVSVSAGWPCPGGTCASTGVSEPLSLSLSLGTFDFPVASERLCIDLLGFSHPALVLAAARHASDYGTTVTVTENPGPHVPYVGATTTGAVTFTSVFNVASGYSATVLPLSSDKRTPAAVATACSKLADTSPMHVLLVFSGAL